MTRVRIFVEVRRVGNNVDILQITIRKSIIIPNINQAMKNDQLHSNHGDKSTGDDVHTAIRVVWVLILPAEILVLVLLKYRSSKPIQLVMMTWQTSVWHTMAAIKILTATIQFRSTSNRGTYRDKQKQRQVQFHKGHEIRRTMTTSYQSMVDTTKTKTKQSTHDILQKERNYFTTSICVHWRSQQRQYINVCFKISMRWQDCHIMGIGIPSILGPCCMMYRLWGWKHSLPIPVEWPVKSHYLPPHPMMMMVIVIILMIIIIIILIMKRIVTKRIRSKQTSSNRQIVVPYINFISL